MATNGYQDDMKPPPCLPVENETSSAVQEISKNQSLKYKNILLISSLHIIAIFGVFYVPLYYTSLSALIFNCLYLHCRGLGVTAGVHRLWTHRTYKAKLPVRIMLAMFFSMAGQNTIPEWVVDHRVHHKHSETDADPHNSNRGFFFSHVGWLFQKKHPEVIKKGKLIDMSDVYDDPVVAFHTKYYVPLYFLFVFIIPVTISCYCFEECLSVAISTDIVCYVASLNATWSVNSAAHLFGNHPFSTRIQPSENIYVSFFALGEGWHNYHHVFPWDYKTAELGNWCFNVTTKYIEILAKLGLVYDLKTASPELVERVAKRFGDGTSRFLKRHHLQQVDQEGSEVNDFGESEIVVPCQNTKEKDH